KWSTVEPAIEDTMLSTSKITSISAGPFATRGVRFSPSIQVNVRAVIATVEFVTGGQYHAIIWRYTTPNIDEILYRSSAFVPTITFRDQHVWQLPVPVALLEGQKYIAAIYRSDQPSGTDVQVYKGTSQTRGFPTAFADTQAWDATNNPTLGQVFGLGGTPDIPNVNLLYTI
ncbi:hypothetical protein LCGC14_2110540, partial [marine sediment metagenome]